MEVKINEHFNYESSSFPMVVIHDTSDPNVVIKHYYMERDIELNFENIIKFISDYFNGSLIPIDPSQNSDMEESNNEEHKKSYSVLVNPNTFRDIVLNSKIHVLLLVYSTKNCNACISAEKDFELIARNIVEASTLTIAKMDVTDSQVEGQTFKEVPSILYYSDSKNKPIIFNFETSIIYSEIKNFIEENLGRKPEDMMDVENLEEELNNLKSTNSIDNTNEEEIDNLKKEL